MRYGPSLRREREEERGHADMSVAASVRCRGRRCGRRRPDRDDQHGREDGLRHEELRHPLEVPEDLAALGHHRRNRSEVAPHEHDVGDALRHLRPRALRDRQACALSARDVVDASPTIARSAPNRGATRRRASSTRARSVRSRSSGGGGARGSSGDSGRSLPSTGCGLDPDVGGDRRHRLGPVARAPSARRPGAGRTRPFREPPAGAARPAPRSQRRQIVRRMVRRSCWTRSRGDDTASGGRLVPRRLLERAQLEQLRRADDDPVAVLGERRRSAASTRTRLQRPRWPRPEVPPGAPRGSRSEPVRRAYFRRSGRDLVLADAFGGQ